MRLTDKERDQLWGEDGPYSQTNLMIQERILDDGVSRVFIEVTVDINPFTYRLIEKNRKEFADDEMIRQLLDHSDWRGQKFGYVSRAFCREYTDEKVMKEAKVHLKYARATVIKMHKYVMKIIANLEGI